MLCLPYRSEIKTTIREAREHFQQEGLRGVNEAHVSTWLKNKLGRNLFQNINLATRVSQKLPSGIATVYVFGPEVLKIKSTVRQDHLDKPDVARYIYCPGHKYGSLLDLIVGTEQTEFPIPDGKLDLIWKS